MKRSGVCLSHKMNTEVPRVPWETTWEPGGGNGKERERKKNFVFYALNVTAGGLHFHISGIRMRIEDISFHWSDLTSLLQILVEWKELYMCTESHFRWIKPFYFFFFHTTSIQQNTQDSHCMLVFRGWHLAGELSTLLKENIILFPCCCASGNFSARGCSS